jgi:hypothetical protein
MKRREFISLLGAGQWTRLQLMEMDAAFCLRMRRAHPERQIGMAAHLILH